MENLTTVDVKNDICEKSVILSVSQVTKGKRKCQPLQGKLNQLIVTAKHVAALHGHLIERFDRNYENGTALGICKYCSSSVTVDAKNNEMGGGELKTTCPNF